LSIEGGARAGLIAPDEKAFEFLKGRRNRRRANPGRRDVLLGNAALRRRRAFDHEIRLDAAKLPPIVTWGTSPEDVVSITGVVPDPDQIADEAKRLSKHRALNYMGLKAGTRITDIKLDRIFIGSCTNGRIEDLRAAAKVVAGKTVNGNLNAMIVPGSGLVKEQAEAEGLDKIFIKAGSSGASRAARCALR